MLSELAVALTWSFLPANGLNNASGVNVSFTLSAKDGDNDTSSATHTISVTDGSGPVVSGPNGGEITLALDDQNLANDHQSEGRPNSPRLRP